MKIGMVKILRMEREKARAVLESIERMDRTGSGSY